jgi:hypothetical protein
MLDRSLIGASVLAAALVMTFAQTITSPARAFDESKYPDLKGQWVRAHVPGVVGQPAYDPMHNQGRPQQPPLKPEFMAQWEASLKDQAEGGQGGDPTYGCLSPGMPRIMVPYGDMEIVVTPETTHFLIEHIHDSRRIFTDGRDWPKDFIDPTFQGYSIGKWYDTDGDGRYDTLEAETRYFKGPRAFDAAGVPLHPDNQTVVKETIHWDRSKPDTLSDQITTIDNALTHPWTVTKTYVRQPIAQPEWLEEVCAEGNNHIGIAGEAYYLSGDGRLMPAKKDQPPPDLRYFKPQK